MTQCPHLEIHGLQPAKEFGVEVEAGQALGAVAQAKRQKRSQKLLSGPGSPTS
jgi:hypothetical protein